jgi:hypothetical protein
MEVFGSLLRRQLESPLARGLRGCLTVIPVWLVSRMVAFARCRAGPVPGDVPFLTGRPRVRARSSNRWKVERSCCREGGSADIFPRLSAHSPRRLIRIARAAAPRALRRLAQGPTYQFPSHTRAHCASSSATGWSCAASKQLCAPACLLHTQRSGPLARRAAGGSAAVGERQHGRRRPVPAFLR